MGADEPLETGVKPAPGDLAVLQAFVNTREVGRYSEKLGTPEELGTWLVKRGLVEPGVTVTEEEHGQALGLRRALRELLAANNGYELDESVVRVIESVSEVSPLVVRADAEGRLHLEPLGKGVRAALGRLLSIALSATVEGTWSRLKACRSDACLWAFYDSSKNRSGVWCEMAVCGSRAKARTYRRRRSKKSGD